MVSWECLIVVGMPPPLPSPVQLVRLVRASRVISRWESRLGLTHGMRRNPRGRPQATMERQRAGPTRLQSCVCPSLAIAHRIRARLALACLY